MPLLSDMISLITAITALRVAKKSSARNTYGWRRLETLGALANGVLLIALCFSLFVSAVERLFTPEAVEDPELVLIVGAVGLGFNIIGLGLLSGSGGGHGHSHSGGHGHSHVVRKADASSCTHNENDHWHGELGLEDSHGHSRFELENGHGHSHANLESEQPSATEKRATRDHNMRGAFLHVAGDALGSVVVIVSAAIIWKVDAPGTVYIDPILTLVVVGILLFHSVPLVRATANILLGTLPSNLDLDDLKNALLDVPGVLQVHELHVWQLTDNKLVASSHIVCVKERLPSISQELHNTFHSHGIHSATLQHEFVEDAAQFHQLDEVSCSMRCRSNQEGSRGTVEDVPCIEAECCTEEQALFTSARRRIVATTI